MYFFGLMVHFYSARVDRIVHLHGSQIKISRTPTCSPSRPGPLSNHLDGQRIPLTGPQAFTVAEQVAVIGDVLGRRLRYQEVDPELVRNRLVDTRASPEFADAYIALQAAVAQQTAVVTGDVEAILGRPPTPFAHWVDTHRDLFSI